METQGVQMLNWTRVSTMELESIVQVFTEIEFSITERTPAFKQKQVPLCDYSLDGIQERISVLDRLIPICQMSC
ncbi:MAG: hypothetical protein Tsb009_25700 [Planctomycetaceae bacterium]